MELDLMSPCVYKWHELDALKRERLTRSRIFTNKTRALEQRGHLQAAWPFLLSALMNGEGATETKDRRVHRFEPDLNKTNVSSDIRARRS
jgi:hypothetical protein